MEDDWYVAECPEVGTASQGTTLEEAVANLREATELYLEEAAYTPRGRQKKPQGIDASKFAVRAYS